MGIKLNKYIEENRIVIKGVVPQIFYVEGKLKTRKWKGDDGVQRYSTEVHVSEFNFLSNKNDVSNTAVNEPPMNPPSTNQDSMASSDNSDDLPF